MTDGTPSSGAATPTQIGADTLKALLRQGGPVTVIDVREPWEFQLCAIPGSRHIPLGVLPGSLDQLAGDGPLVMVCHHGMRSLQATLWLRGNGYENAVNLAGGIDAWARDIDPAMVRY